MELLLNLAWLLLALPAYWLWRDSKLAPAERRFSSLQRLLALGCVLVILFPVISATDDLLAMRAEMEESPASKRSICQKSSDKPSFSRSLSQPLLASSSLPAVLVDVAWHFVPPSRISTAPAPVVVPSGRAPPADYLS